MQLLIKEFFSGFLVGIANIIPGVSGGTFLLILGMFQRVMSAVGGLNVATITAMLKHAAGILFGRDRKASFNALKKLIADHDLFFLMRIALGAGTAIVVLSDLMMYLLSQQISGTYAFFFGLIIVSTIMSLRMIEKITPARAIVLVIGAVVTVGVTVMVNPADKIKTKSDHYKTIYEQSAAQTTQSEATTSKDTKPLYAGVYTPAEYVAGMFAGALGVSAMVLPGISGSLVLILVGQYHKVIGAISSLRTLTLDPIIFLTLFALGMLIGMLLFARLVTFVFKHAYNGTLAFLTGLMAGSLYTLWPFKSSLIMDQYVKGTEGISLVKNVVVQTNINTLPENTTVLVVAILLCGIGAGIMVFLGRFKEE